MLKNIIITCGTSLFTNIWNKDFKSLYWLSWETFNYKDFELFQNNIKKLSENPALNTPIDIDCNDEMGECEIEQQIKKYLISWFNEIEINSIFFKKLSAEITLVDSLINSKKLKEKWENLNIEKDNIYLFFSDTLDGQLVAEVLEYVFIEKLWIKNLKLKKIENFIVKWEWSAKVFQRKAIKNYFSQLEEIKTNEKNSETSSEQQNLQTIMCPVWWYKALIPYSTIYAMTQWWDMYYIYENSDELISLPNGMLNYMLLKAWIQDKEYKDVIKKLEEWENNIFSQNIEDFNNIVKLIEATNRFVELGDLSGFSWIKFKDKNLEWVNVLLKKFVEFDMKIKFWQIRDKEEIEKLIEEIQNFESSKNILILSPIFNKLKEEFNIFKLNESDIDYYFSILEFYKKHGLFLQWFLFMREILIDMFIYYILNIKIKDSYDIKIITYSKDNKISKKDIRNNIPNIIKNIFSEKENKNINICILDKNNNLRTIIVEENIIKKYTFNNIKDKDKIWDKLISIRNNFAHYNPNNNSKIIEDFSSCYQKIIEINIFFKKMEEKKKV